MNPQLPKLFLALGLALTLGACASTPAASALGYGRFAGIHPGLTQAEVRSVAGAPASVTREPGTNEPEWLYPFVDSWGMRSEYDVTFDASGHVDRTSSMRLGF